MKPGVAKRPDSAKSYAAVPAVVYIARSPAGEILYVGVTRNLRTRMAVHKSKGSGWWSPDVSLEVEHFERRHDAERREQELIDRLKPPFNFHGHSLVRIGVDLYAECARLAEANGETVAAFVARSLRAEASRQRDQSANEEPHQ